MHIYKKKKILLSLMALSAVFFFAACGGGDSSAPSGGGDVLSKKFWARDIGNDIYYQLNADRLASGAYCTVWAETGSSVTEAQARQVAGEYDRIKSKLSPYFELNFIVQQMGTLSTSAFADYLGDGDGRVCILFLNIRDGSKVNEPYVAGFFSGVNFLSGTHSNECDMIYINVKALEKKDEVFTTLAHETTHMYNFINGNILMNNDQKDYLLDLWIDEGLANFAEWVYSGKIDEDHVAWFNKDTRSEINTGNNFFVWDNRPSPYAIMDEYATVYLFFQWLRVQASNSTGIFNDIIRSKEADYQAVLYAANKNITKKSYPVSASGWSTLLQDWLVANYKNESTGVNGYMNVSVLNTIKQPLHGGGTTSINLAPGEGVYSKGSSVGGGGGANIKYVPGNERDSVIALLTYNSKTLNDADKNKPGYGAPESGTITGAASVTIASPSRSIMTSLPIRRISMQDALRRNGHDNSFTKADLNELQLQIENRLAIDE